jgi:glycosyltransferase involved in cell wall biosynthesis
MDSSEHPLIDVVLTTYGPVPYIEQALDSVLAQTYPNWRLTVVDNSPETGGARGALDGYPEDPRVRYLATGGLNQAENWTAAFRSADAPYIAMIHDDDFWEPEFLARRAAALEAHPECAIAFSAYREIDGDGREIALRAPRVPEGVLRPEAFVPVEFVRNAIPTCAVLYRRSAFEAVGGSFDADSGYIDYDLWMRLAVRYPVYSLHVWDCSMRFHEGSVTATFHSSKRNGELWLRFVERAEAAIDAVNPDLVPQRVRRRRRAAALLSIAADELEADNRAEAKRVLRGALRLHPRSVLDPRVPVMALALATGPRASRLLISARSLKVRLDIPTHDHDVKRRIDDLRVGAGRRWGRAA